MPLESLGLAALHRLDPERAHRLAIRLLQAGLYPRRPLPPDPLLETTAFGLTFPNPLGLAAGFDKSAEAYAALLDLGFGHVEVGTLTPRRQTGNPRPRVFRLVEDQAVCNRYGFNNDGLKRGLQRLAGRNRSAGIVGINIGINKDSTDPVADYAGAMRDAAEFGDYLAVNVSSPNTPGLRDLQEADRLDGLLKAVTLEGGSAVPILLKISPDVTRPMVVDIVEIAVARGIAGIIVANTTITRPSGLFSPHRKESGGLSGKPLFALSTRVLAWTYLAAAGRTSVIGAGGVDSPETAYAKIRAGASLLQVYTGLIYGGASLVRKICDGLANQLRVDGFSRVVDAVGNEAVAWAAATDGAESGIQTVRECDMTEGEI